MKQYLALLDELLNKGQLRSDRTGVGTYGLFGLQFRHNMQEGFPLLTTKKMHIRSIIYELLWFLKGRTDNKYLADNGVTIWDEWVKEDGTLGPVYGKQWRAWAGPYGPIDQLTELIRNLKRDPFSRRHVVSAWNVGDLPHMALATCHCLFQMHVRESLVPGGKHILSLHLYQRSADYFLGVPFNIASYGILLHILAAICDYDVGDLITSYGDVHLYTNHVEQAKLQLTREPMPLCKLQIVPTPGLPLYDLDSLDFENIKIIDYVSHERIAAPVAA